MHLTVHNKYECFEQVMLMKNEWGVVYLTVPMLYQCHLVLETAGLQGDATWESCTSGRSLAVKKMYRSDRNIQTIALTNELRLKKNHYRPLKIRFLGLNVFCNWFLVTFHKQNALVSCSDGGVLLLIFSF